MKKREIKNLTEKDLKEKIIELKKELIKIKSSSTIANPSKIRINKRLIAHILTKINKGGIKK
ncbi:50S ribosomal protein L29 [Candidatus Woesearchaeota archaeon]|nr:50S ribosomal protein L29 [Candidatus Woesearchaeota archaeon]